MSPQQDAKGHRPAGLAPQDYQHRSRRMSTQQDAECHRPEELAPQGFGTGGAE